MGWLSSYVGPAMPGMSLLNYLSDDSHETPYRSTDSREGFGDKSSEDFMQDVINYKPEPFTGKYSGETYFPASYADSTFYSFLDELNFQDGLGGEFNPKPIYSDDEIAKDLKALWLGGGAPAIAQKDPFYLEKKGGGDFGRGFMLPGYKPSHLEGSDYQRELDELYIRTGDLQQFIAETSHSLDFNVPPGERKDLLDRGYEEATEDFEGKEHGGTGEERYDFEGSIEHHAHRETEIELLNDLRNKGFTNPDLWRNINPYMEEDYTRRMINKMTDIDEIERAFKHHVQSNPDTRLNVEIKRD